MTTESQQVQLERSPDGGLIAVRGGQRIPVQLRRCFPWTSPTRYLSLRDEDEGEVALVADPASLDATSRAVLEQSLAEVGFILRINFIESVKEEFEIRVWRVGTEQGPRQFQTAKDEWPREIPGGGVLIRDVAGDLYHIADPNALDEKSRETLWLYVD